MPVNGFRTITKLQRKPDKDELVRDTNGREWVVLEVGSKYAKCGIPGDTKGLSLMIKFGDLVYGTEVGYSAE